tara:strand:- start:4801 stop:4935 length:135 start_codon:yes stop_codon:yes gene_type:complete
MWESKEMKSVAGVVVALVIAYYALGAYENYLAIKEYKSNGRKEE